MTLLAILATVATVVVIVIVVIKVATSTGHAVAKAAARLWAWAGEPWAAAAKATAAGVRTGSGHGWSAAHGQRSMPGTPAKATATGTPVAPGIHGTTTVIDPPDPTPEMRDKAAKAAALGGRVGYRVGWGTGVGAATTTRALRHGRAGAKHAWRAAHPKPVTESGRPITWEYDFAPACQHCNVCGLDIPAETWDEATADLIAHRKSAHGLTGTGQDDDAPDDDDESGPAYCPHGIYALNHCPQCPDSPRWNAGEDPPPQTNPITPPAEPTGLWMKESTVTYQIPSEIEDHADLIAAMEGILNDIGAGEDLSEEIAEMETLLAESSTIHERFGRDFGVETTGKVTAFEEQAAAAKVAMEQLRAALEGMVEATTAVKDEAVVAVGS